MARTGPTTLNLPAFSGATRKLVLMLLAAFFADAILGLVVPQAFYSTIHLHLMLRPVAVVHGQIWQLGTYLFLPLGILSMVFALLTLWFTGSMLEDIRGARWVYELFFTSAIAGAIVACAVCYTRWFHLDPSASAGIGPYAGIYGLLVAVAVLMGDVEFLLLFLVRIKARYMVAIIILIDVATLLKQGNAFVALLQLCGALAGFLYVRTVSRAGLTYALSARADTLRTDFYRVRRRRAAKKFEVYMGKQGRTDIRFDKDGRYIDPDLDTAKRDPSDKRWMN